MRHEFPMRPDACADPTSRLVRQSRARQWQRLRVAVLLPLLLVTAGATTTETIEPLPAIGRLDFAGHEDRFHCTATLVGADRALTAAHCLEPPASIANTYFQPGFAIDRGAERLQVRSWHTELAGGDVALLCLATDARTPRLPVAERGPSPGEGLTVVGYGIPADRGQRHDSCTVDEIRGDGSFVLNCPLRPGQSGAPVLRHTAQGREVVGVAYATSNRQSLAWAISAATALPECR